MNKIEKQIDKALQEYEDFAPYPQHNIEWITNRIDWAWKWRKISKELMESFCDRAIKIIEGGIYE